MPQLRILFILLMILAPFVQSCHSGSAPAHPNVLLILVDDLGARDLGYTGSNFYETPNIDALAANSTIFTHAYSGSRVCSPSRATLLTGQFTARHGITDWIGAKAGPDWRSLNRHDKLLPATYKHSLPGDGITLAETMKAHGYQTFFAGKWHLGEKGSYPEDHGFDINAGGWEKGSPAGGYFSPFANPNLPNHQSGENLTMRLAKETTRFLNQQGDQPFFAMLSFYAVHGPVQTTRVKWAKYQQKAMAGQPPESGFEMEQHLPLRLTQDNPVYAGLVETMDDAVGLVMDELAALGLDQNTLVIFTSDNGGVASGDSYSTSNLPMRGGKGYQWEGGTRVPFLIYVPWQHSQKFRIDYPITGADVYPTILDYANIPLLPDQHQDGISLRTFTEGRGEQVERPLYWHYPHYGNQGGNPSSVIRKGKWKLILFYEDYHSELYDLSLDPGESRDMAHIYPDTASLLLANLQSWLEKTGALTPKQDLLYDADARARYDSTVVNRLWPGVEKQRQQMLSAGYQPNSDWWGSEVADQ